MNQFHLLTLVSCQLVLALSVQAGLFDFTKPKQNQEKEQNKPTDPNNQPNLRLDPQAIEIAYELDNLDSLNHRRIRGSQKKSTANSDLCDLLLRANQNGFSYKNMKHIQVQDESDDSSNPQIDVIAPTEPTNEITKNPKKPFRPNLGRPKDAQTTSGSSGLSIPKYCTAGFLKKKIKGAYTSTKLGFKPVAKAFKDIPKYAIQATESVSTLLNLDNKGRIAALIEATDNDMKFIREEYSKFAMSWSPLMEATLNYVGKEDLNHLKWNDRDEFDLRRDALNSLAVGYEFMNMFISWRENLLTAHAAFKNYIDAFKQELPERKDIVIDDYLIYQLESIHSYMLFKSWLQIDAEIVEPSMKLVYVLEKYDEEVKNYESDYFRHIVFYHELFDPTLEEFAAERKLVLDTIGTAGDLVEEFKEVDQFLNEFQDEIANNEELRKNIDVPEAMYDFMEDIKPQIRFNPRVYGSQKLKELMAALKATPKSQMIK